jgi:TonB-dependent starch-binding outer membrane protein SusC
MDPRAIASCLAWATVLCSTVPAEASAVRVLQTRTVPLVERPAKLDVERVHLQAALETLARSSGVAFAYSPSRLPADARVTCACRKASVAEALDRLLAGTGFTFREADGQVVLVPVPAPAPAPAVPPPATSSVDVGDTPAALAPPESSNAAAPPAPVATLTGTIVAAAGGPVSDATVTLPGAGLSTLSDGAGQFRLVVPLDDAAGRGDTLHVERLGYATTAVPVALRDGAVHVDAVLPLQALALDRIVVTGTAGNQERRAQAALVATVDAADVLRDGPVSNVTQVLQSRLPGVTVTESSGTTGAGARIDIRGAASISLSNQPLVFLDGVRIDGGPRGLVNVSGAATVGQAPSALNDLNPADIASIEVVKGPAAATLYGADASAGVIQIITKRGSVGSRSFVQEAALGYDRIEPNFTVPTNYARCTAPLVEAGSPNPLCRGRDVGALVADNPAERIGAFRAGWLGSFRYSARGGDENYGYFLSFGMANEQGTTPNNALKQRTGRVNFTFAPTPRLTLDAGFSLARTDHALPRTDQDTYGYYLQSILGSPLTVTDAAGTLQGGLLFGSSTLASLSSIESRVKALRTTPSLQLRYAPAPWFTHRLTMGADLTQGSGFELFPRNDQGWYPTRPAPGTGDVTTTQEDDRSYTVDYLGNVTADFGAAGMVSSNLSFGAQYIHRITSVLRGAGEGLATNGSYLVDNAAVSTVGQGFGEARSLGLFVQEQIGFRDRLFLQLGLRADRNSAFGADVGTFFLPKLGASWVVSEEPFWRAARALVPTLRLRAAYGTTGRSPAPGAALRTYGTAAYVTEDGLLELGLVPGSPGNDDLRPERGKELELGVDASIIDDRVGAEVTFFEKRSTDLLVAVPVAPSGGFGANPFGNIGEVVNRGVEFQLRATPVRRDDVIWDVTVNGGTLHNEITDLGTVGTFISSFRAFVPGHQVAAFWIHRIRSVDVESGRVIVSDTAEFAGNQLPAFHGNLTTSVTLFRTLRLHALFERKSGYRVLNLNQEYRDRSSRSSASVSLPADQGGYTAAERLRRLGPYVSETTGLPVGVANVKEPYIQDGGHVRFRELSATLFLPPSLAARVGATGASLTIGARNLALWGSSYEGHDPDVLGTGPQAAGLHQLFNADLFTTPPPRRWTARLTVQF